VILSLAWRVRGTLLLKALDHATAAVDLTGSAPDAICVRALCLARTSLRKDGRMLHMSANIEATSLFHTLFTHTDSWHMRQAVRLALKYIPPNDAAWASARKTWEERATKLGIAVAAQQTDPQQSSASSKKKNPVAATPDWYLPGDAFVLGDLRASAAGGDPDNDPAADDDEDEF
jgi:hypothetical protein